MASEKQQQLLELFLENSGYDENNICLYWQIGYQEHDIRRGWVAEYKETHEPRYGYDEYPYTYTETFYDFYLGDSFYEAVYWLNNYKVSLDNFEFWNPDNWPMRRTLASNIEYIW